MGVIVAWLSVSSCAISCSRGRQSEDELGSGVGCSVVCRGGGFVRCVVSLRIAHS